jgi:hypothetical protein
MTDPTMRKCHVEPIARIRHIYILSRPPPFFSQTQSATVPPLPASKRKGNSVSTAEQYRAFA